MKRSLTDIRENLDYVGCDNETARELCDEVERLRDIVDRLPTTADGVPVVAGDTIWTCLRYGFITPVTISHQPQGGVYQHCYSTLEALKEAWKKLETGDAGEV